ncbi:DUF397 domain-containing protein [Streptomyces celluloflavus]|uniref:DUF397 domain-containing protein n=1 Tax=Streptomyces celluloflavus TaxID=58344 RepID=UPI00345F7186|nr:DUF397 domain-containing protein [Streptomyces celluloflavus]WSK17177.1 DUF397 domain-containing protein [Streptomyces celluloflavus]
MTSESPSLRWVKSSYSGSGGTCVEWSPTTTAVTGAVPVRDSKDPHGPVLTIAPAAWSTFVGSVKTGELSA